MSRCRNSGRVRTRFDPNQVHVVVKADRVGDPLSVQLIAVHTHPGHDLHSSCFTFSALRVPESLPATSHNGQPQRDPIVQAATKIEDLVGWVAGVEQGPYGVGRLPHCGPLQKNTVGRS